MITKIVKRYYCEFCKKSGGSSFYMNRHEKHCTLNPERSCRMCEYAFGGYAHNMTELIAILGNGENDKFKVLKEHVEGCPACILAALRQGKPYHDLTIENQHLFDLASQFDFKAESKNFLQDFKPDREYGDYYF